MGTRIRRLLAAAVVVFGVTTAATAQTIQSGQSGQPHRGIVHDHTGKPMPGVVVVLDHPQENAVRVAVTNLWGEYVVNDLDGGTRYNVHIRHPGFRDARLQASAGDHVNVCLKPRRSGQGEAQPASVVAHR